jgi:hypothetical protein
MKHSTFGSLLWSSILQSWGGALTAGGFAAAVVGFFVTPAAETLPLRWYVVTVLVAFFLVVVLARAAWLAHLEAAPSIPRVRYANAAPKAYSGAYALFLLDPTPNLSHDALVSIYYLEDEVERLVGLGRVINVQNNGKVQVLVVANYDFGDRLDAIRSNSVDELKKIIVKTSIPGLVMEGQEDV